MHDSSSSLNWIRTAAPCSLHAYVPFTPFMSQESCVNKAHPLVLVHLKVTSTLTFHNRVYMRLSFTLAWIVNLYMSWVNTSKVINALLCHPVFLCHLLPDWELVHVHIKWLRQEVSAVLLYWLLDAGRFVKGLMMHWLVPMFSFILSSAKVASVDLSFFIPP
jgi:hypothetical protein